MEAYAVCSRHQSRQQDSVANHSRDTTSNKNRENCPEVILQPITAAVEQVLSNKISGMRSRSRSVDLLCLGLTSGRRGLKNADRRMSVFYTDFYGETEPKTSFDPTKEEEERSLASKDTNRKGATVPALRTLGETKDNVRAWVTLCGKKARGQQQRSEDVVISEKQAVGVGVALCDNNPSPYDREGLPFRAGDRVEILAMNPNGMWRGRVRGREGTFKFIHVKLLDKNCPPKRHASSSRGGAADYLEVSQVLREAGLSHLAPLFILNGYETMEELRGITSSELDYLGVSEEAHGRICAAAMTLALRTSLNTASQQGNMAGSSAFSDFGTESMDRSDAKSNSQSQAIRISATASSQSETITLRSQSTCQSNSRRRSSTPLNGRSQPIRLSSTTSSQSQSITDLSLLAKEGSSSEYLDKKLTMNQWERSKLNTNQSEHSKSIMHQWEERKSFLYNHVKQSHLNSVIIIRL
jgi:hypothetical protein